MSRFNSGRRTVSLIVAVVAFLAQSIAPRAAAPDYGGYRPHYQGYGVNTSGGRGGVVCRVTSLSDAASPANAGTLRYCLERVLDARFVIFEISGMITLQQGPLTIRNPYVTIAGQTAPSPGITVRGPGLIIDTHDVVVQHLRIRVGNVANEPVGLWIRDDANNVVADHLSVTWAIWDGVSVSAYRPGHPPRDATIIDSIIAESLACSGVNKAAPCDPAGYPLRGQSNSRAMAIGDAWQQGNPRVAMIRNISANNNDRHPEIGGSTQTILVNNLIYNPSLTPLAVILYEDAIGKGPTFSVVQGNLVVPGPTTPGYDGYRAPEYPEEGDLTFVRVDHTLDSRSRIYLDGNYYEKDCGGAACLDNPAEQWRLAKDFKWDWERVNIRATTPPLELANLPLSSALPFSSVEDYVKANAGARPLDRDVADTRIIDEITARSGFVPNTTSEKAGPGTSDDGYPMLAVRRRALTLPADPNAVVDGVGRTMIEAWLEAFARQLEPARNEQN